MDVLWCACLTAIAVMLAIPVLAALAGLAGRTLAGVLRRLRAGAVVQLRLPLRDNPPRKLERLRAGLGLEG